MCEYSPAILCSCEGKIGKINVILSCGSDPNDRTLLCVNRSLLCVNTSLLCVNMSLLRNRAENEDLGKI